MDNTGYPALRERLERGEVVLLDGGTGTELERRGVAMDPGAWCGPASLSSEPVLEQVHLDYIAAGADVITANTYASSRLMLEAAGHGARFEEINRRAVAAAHRARSRSGQEHVLVAGSLSHMAPMTPGTARADPSRAPSPSQLGDAFAELAMLLADEGCDLIALEMMYLPERVGPALDAATATGLPVWVGFSARRGADGEPLSFAPDRDIALRSLIETVAERDVQACGIMHTPSDLVGDALQVVQQVAPGPYLAYPDSGYFRMPHWEFDDVITPAALSAFARQWMEQGVKILGGCCGLSPAHIRALAELARAA